MFEEKKLNDILRQKTIDCGLCTQWQREWREDWNADKMASQFYRGIDFFLMKRYISLAEINEFFDKKWLRENGILANDKYSLLNPEHAILLGNSKSTLRFNAMNVADVYVVDDSWAKVIVKDRAFVLIHVLGKAQIDVKLYGHATCTVLNHSRESVINADESVKVKEDLNYLK